MAVLLHKNTKKIWQKYRKIGAKKPWIFLTFVVE